MARVGYRISQGLAYLRPRRAERVDARLRALLTQTEFDLLRHLSLPDREHHLTVYERLARHGCGDADLLKAALLHDTGKADGGTRVGLWDRTLAVILSTAGPGMLERLGNAEGRRWRRSLHLAATHARRGAVLARNIGCNDRVCWLIAHHHDHGIDDKDLALLQRADDGQLR